MSVLSGDILLRYFTFKVIAGTFLAVLALLALDLFVAFASQLPELKEGVYEWPDALQYVALTTPRRIFQQVQFSVLLGVMLGLGGLASGSELTAIRAAGVSPYKMAAMVAVPALIVALLVFVMSEYLMPPAEKLARDARANLVAGEASWAGAMGMWVRSGSQVVNVLDPQLKKVDQGVWSIGGVRVFDLTEDNRVAKIRRSPRVLIDERQWRMESAEVLEFHESGEVVKQERSESLPAPFDLRMLKLADTRPKYMSLAELSVYLEHLDLNRLDSIEYRLAWWQHILAPVITVLMAMLAMPFLLGSLRDKGVGAYIFSGLAVGLVFFLFNRTVANLAHVTGLDPALTSLMPVLLLLAFLWVRLSRI